MQQDPTLLQKRKQFQHYLSKQQKQRQQALALKKQKDADTKNTSQKMLVIQKQFRQKQLEVNELVGKYRKQEVPYEDVLEKYNQLKDYYLKINYALLAFDRQTYKEALEKILNEMQDLKKKLEPRKRFKFSRRDEDFGVKVTKQELQLESKSIEHQASIPGLSNITSQTLTIPSSQLNTPFKITNATDCTIYLPGITDILFLKNLKNCRIYAGPTRSTVFVDRCLDCEIEINCHQMRIHNTERTRFGVWTSSKGIIEDTKEVVFKRYGWRYEGVEEDVRRCEREGKENLWRDVQDFNWLKQEASPNFAIVEGETFE